VPFRGRGGMGYRGGWFARRAPMSEMDHRPRRRPQLRSRSRSRSQSRSSRSRSRSKTSSRSHSAEAGSHSRKRDVNIFFLLALIAVDILKKCLDFTNYIEKNF